MIQLFNVYTKGVMFYPNAAIWPNAVLDTSRPYVAFLGNVGYKPMAMNIFKSNNKEREASSFTDDEANNVRVIGLMEVKKAHDEDMVTWIALFPEE